MSSNKTHPSFIFWEDSWNYSREVLDDKDDETIIPDKL